MMNFSIHQLKCFLIHHCYSPLFHLHQSNTQMKLNVFIFLTALAMFSLSVFMIRQTQPDEDEINDFSNSTIKRQVYKETQFTFDNYNNPPPPKKSTMSPNEMLYIAIMDTEYGPKKYQCISKRQWVDELNKKPFVDGIEYYSGKHWKNSECGILTIVTPKSVFNSPNPSPWILLSTLNMFLKRSSSNWLMLINDAAYMRVDLFESQFHKMIQQKRPDIYSVAYGSCIDLRYFFQMLLFDSGVILSRKTVERLVGQEAKETWEVVCEVGIEAQEALSHLLPHAGIYVRSGSSTNFLGREFQFEIEYKRLLEKNFANLSVCNVPLIYTQNIPGECGVCTKHITRFKDVSIWSGHGKHMSKIEFLMNADKMLKDIPDDVGWFWNPTRPKICKVA
ncbi:hypothetical protein TRFO_01201 [Tritrichomonas foetus]|uniref:Uncharacterized protein n=1 Tax=Tritrichomonas foetus TaxID=1144522 RepID=A0A1J4KJW9_9EUKA|nr:hypothetical protein TRFO_01201 [Tritrichomonas foetus]|eukprot:OHT11240.1 hypothetical protein TRFO_01201 [Tritrichomonas foetus]